MNDIKKILFPDEFYNRSVVRTSSVKLPGLGNSDVKRKGN